MNSFTKESNSIFIYGTDFKDINFYLKSFSLPSITLSELQYRNSTGNYFLTPDELSYSDISLSILLDENMEIYNKLITEIFRLKNVKDGIVDLNNRTSTLMITNNKGNDVAHIMFKGAYLSSIGEIPFNNNSLEDLHLSIDVTIKFSEMEFIQKTNKERIK